MRWWIFIYLFMVSAVSYADECYFNKGDEKIPLYGKVQIVESFPDLKVQIVESFADLDVLIVSSFPDDCGKIQIVESFPDVRVQIVESFPDIKVRIVSAFPGTTSLFESKQNDSSK